MMKNVKIMLLCLLSVASINLIAKSHKQQIHLSNQSEDKTKANRDILVHITWKNGMQTRYTDVILKAHRKDLMIKAPISGYKLFSIDATPAINLASLSIGATPLLYGLKGVDAGIAGIAYGITHALNHHTIRAHGHTFFVIDTESKKSKLASQKQVRIRGYKTQEEYHHIIGKAETVEVDEDPETSDSSDYQVVVATENANEAVID